VSSSRRSNSEGLPPTVRHKFRSESTLCLSPRTPNSLPSRLRVERCRQTEAETGPKDARSSSDDTLTAGTKKPTGRGGQRYKNKHHASLAPNSSDFPAPAVDSDPCQQEAHEVPSSGTSLPSCEEPSSLDDDPGGYGTGPLADLLQQVGDAAAVWGFHHSPGAYPGSGTQAQGISWAPQMHLYPGGLQPWQQMGGWPWPFPCNNMASGSSMGSPFHTPSFNGQGWGWDAQTRQLQWGPLPSSGGYLCHPSNPYFPNGRVRFPPGPLDHDQHIAWNGIITNSAAYASPDENAHAPASSEDLSTGVDEESFVPSDEVSPPGDEEGLLPEADVFHSGDRGEIGLDAPPHCSDDAAFDAQADSFQYEVREDVFWCYGNVHESGNVEGTHSVGDNINNDASGNFEPPVDASVGDTAGSLPPGDSSSLSFSVDRTMDAKEPNASGFDDSGGPPNDEDENDRDFEAEINDSGSEQHVDPDCRCELCAAWDTKNETVPFCGCDEGRFHPACLASAGTWKPALECIKCHGLTRNGIRRPIPAVVKQRALWYHLGGKWYKHIDLPNNLDPWY